MIELLIDNEIGDMVGGKCNTLCPTLQADLLSAGKNRNKGKKRQRSKFIDDHAEVVDKKEENGYEGADVIEEYELRSPGNSQDPKWEGPRVVGDEAPVIYSCPVTGRGIKNDKYTSDSKKRLLTRIRQWKLQCTIENIDESRRKDLITGLRDIKTAMDEAVALDMSSLSSFSDVRTKLREGRYHVSF